MFLTLYRIGIKNLWTLPILIPSLTTLRIYWGSVKLGLPLLRIRTYLNHLWLK